MRGLLLGIVLSLVCPGLLLADHPTPMGVDPAVWHRNKGGEEKMHLESQERNRVMSCNSLFDSGARDKCLRNEPIPDGYSSWENYSSTKVALQREQSRARQIREDQERQQARIESQKRAEEAEAEQQRRQQETRAEQKRRELAAELEQVARQQQIEEERRKLAEQRRVNQQSQTNQVEYRQPEVPRSSFGALQGLITIVLLAGGGFTWVYFSAWWKQRELNRLQGFRRTLITDWGSLAQFQKQLNWLDEQMRMSEVQRWQPEHWKEFIRADVLKNWDDYQQDRDNLFDQFNRYTNRTWEAEVTIAEVDFGRRTDRTEQLMNLFHRQSDLRWRLITAVEKPYVARPQSLPS
jgi:hypothetical protein